MDIATELDIIHKAGAWFSYEGNKIGQGRENTKEFLLAHPDMMAEVEEKILAAKNEVVMTSAKDKKAAVLSAASAAAAKVSSNDVIVDAEDDFEEFTPAEK